MPPETRKGGREGGKKGKKEDRKCARKEGKEGGRNEGKKEGGKEGRKGEKREILVALSPHTVCYLLVSFISLATSEYSYLLMKKNPD